MQNQPITIETAAKVLEIVDAGLVSGLGKAIPGQMCVEAAVCYALGLPHGDDPGCVSPAVRALKIVLNDANWSSPAARAKGMRRLAIIQLGTAGEVDDVAFAKAVAEMTISTVVPAALRSAASLLTGEHKAALEAAAIRCETEGTSDAARAASYAASDAASDASDASDAARAASAGSQPCRQGYRSNSFRGVCCSDTRKF
jgi:hypothetical protein